MTSQLRKPQPSQKVAMKQTTLDNTPPGLKKADNSPLGRTRGAIKKEGTYKNVRVVGGSPNKDRWVDKHLNVHSYQETPGSNRLQERHT